MNQDTRLHKLLRLLGLLGVLGILLTAYTPLPNVLARALATSSQIQPADAIVVLGGSVYRDGTLGDSSLRRAIQGITLYHRGFAPLIVLSGTSYAGSPVEAEVRAALARQLGVPEKAILLEPHAQTTAEEAHRIAPRLLQRNAKRILLVSSSLHLPRAVPRFERYGLKVFPVVADDTPVDTDGTDERLDLMRHVLREALGRWLYRAGD
ncbi:MAG: YdcF family protein [Armatimonadota bacterium]|nr:YdcF family protein [bacterium]MDW8322408.1 YdcF family protein [Armatimonadota bacterium]